jgi:hypothetical protein
VCIFGSRSAVHLLAKTHRITRTNLLAFPDQQC